MGGLLVLYGCKHFCRTPVVLICISTVAEAGLACMYVTASAAILQLTPLHHLKFVYVYDICLHLSLSFISNLSTHVYHSVIYHCMDDVVHLFFIVLFASPMVYHKLLGFLFLFALLMVNHELSLVWGLVRVISIA